MVFVIVAPIILLGAVFLYAVFSEFADSGQPTHKQLAFISRDTNSKLYIKTENWGVNGDSQLTIITPEGNVEFEIDSAKQIIFRGLQPFFYKQSNDTLILCVSKKAVIPKNFNSPWTIIQKEIDNGKMIDLRRNYEYKGI